MAKGSFPTLAALQAAYPSGTSGTYLVLENSTSYTWTGGAWTAGSLFYVDRVTTLEYRLREVTYNVKDAGAKGDGIAGDSAAINAAIQYAYANKIFNVFIPEGTYILDAPIIMEQHINLYGGGWRTFLKIKDGTDIDAIKTNGLGHEANIGYLTIDCNKQNNTFSRGGSAINGHFDTSIIEFVRIKNCSVAAMRINDDGDIYGDLGYLNTIRNNQIEDCNIGIKWSWRATDSWILNNNIGSDFCNVYVQGGSLRFLNNHFNGNPEYNMYIEGGNTILIANNLIENAGKHAIYGPELGFDDAFRNININGNIIRACSRETNNTYNLIHMEGRTTKLGTGLCVVGNTLIGDNGRLPKYVAHVKNAKNVVIQSNITVDGFTGTNPFQLIAVTADSISGNVPSNGIDKT